MTKRKVKVQEEVESTLDPRFDNPEFAKAADHLIGAIRDFGLRLENVSYNKEEILRVANKILEGRLND